MKRLLILCLLAGCFVSCRDLPEERPAEKDTGTEATYFSTEDPHYRTCGNEKFNFWFDLPEGWRAVDRSAVGDGYFIECGGQETDIRIYGIYVETKDEESIKELVGNAGQSEPFTFRDGNRGTVLQADGIRYFVRNASPVRIMLYVKADEEWYRENEETILRMARSMRFGK